MTFLWDNHIICKSLNETEIRIHTVVERGKAKDTLEETAKVTLVGETQFVADFLNVLLSLGKEKESLDSQTAVDNVLRRTARETANHLGQVFAGDTQQVSIERHVVTGLVILMDQLEEPGAQTPAGHTGVGQVGKLHTGLLRLVAHLHKDAEHRIGNLSGELTRLLVAGIVIDIIE